MSLHLLRALAKQNPDRAFVFFCGAHYHDQLNEVVQDLPNLALDSFESTMWARYDRVAVDLWKNADDAWVTSPLRWDWSGYTLWHHKAMARRMGFESPFTHPSQLLFDFPALENIPKWGKEGHIEHDFLIVNSEPCSGQFGPMKQHASGYMNQFMANLSKRHRVLVTNRDNFMPLHCAHLMPNVKCTQDENKSLAQIGALSRICRHVLGVMTGPLWPCLNTHRHHDASKRTIAMLDNGEALNLPRVEQVANVEELFAVARTEGWL